jgi:ABC-type transport system substrate-binding protein
MLLYALHDALVKPMPDHPMAPSLATAWRESEDGRTYGFELRQGVTFHNGDPFTAEDVQFTAVCTCIHDVLRVGIDDDDRRGDGHETRLPGSTPPDCPRLCA